jgi:hypothetical protein
VSLLAFLLGQDAACYWEVYKRQQQLGRGRCRAHQCCSGVLVDNGGCRDCSSLQPQPSAVDTQLQTPASSSVLQAELIISADSQGVRHCLEQGRDGLQV